VSRFSHADLDRVRRRGAAPSARTNSVAPSIHPTMRRRRSPAIEHDGSSSATAAVVGRAASSASTRALNG
jgi:hypothetical protein